MTPVVTESVFPDVYYYSGKRVGLNTVDSKRYAQLFQFFGVLIIDRTQIGDVLSPP
jgi:hypothetical protein